MYKGIDYITGEIIESMNKKELIIELNNRFINYNQTKEKVYCYFIKGVYYIGKYY